MIYVVVFACVLMMVIIDDIRVRLDREEMREKLASYPRRGASGKFEKRG